MKPARILTEALAGVSLGLAFVYLASPPLWSLVEPGGASSQPVAQTELERCTRVSDGDGEMLIVQFTVFNHGGRRLILRRLDEGCNCSSTREGAIYVQAGGERRVTVRLPVTRGSRADELRLAYETNDPRQPVIWLHCTP